MILISVANILIFSNFLVSLFIQVFQVIYFSDFFDSVLRLYWFIFSDIFLDISDNFISTISMVYSHKHIGSIDSLLEISHVHCLSIVFCVVTALYFVLCIYLKEDEQKIFYLVFFG
jgi:hypothetical protein